MNPLINMLGASNPMINQLLNFVKTFRGNPQQQIDELMKSGKVTQEQYNEAVARAKQIEPVLRGLMK